MQFKKKNVTKQNACRRHCSVRQYSTEVLRFGRSRIRPDVACMVYMLYRAYSNQMQRKKMKEVWMVFSSPACTKTVIRSLAAFNLFTVLTVLMPFKARLAPAKFDQVKYGFESHVASDVVVQLKCAT